jgi:hypothetical protein
MSWKRMIEELEPSGTGRKQRVAVVGTDLDRVTSLGIALERAYDPAIVHSDRPLRDAARAAADAPACVIAPISHADSVVDVRTLIDAAGPTRIVFLAQSLPLSHGVARLIRLAGHGVLDRQEPAAVIEATMAALLAPHDRP